MSFSKAELKRFNETTGCAPPVGAYDPKENKKTGGAVIDKSDRFKHPQDVGSGGLSKSSLESLSAPKDSSMLVKGKGNSNNSSRSTSCESLNLKTPTKNTVKKSAQMSEHLARVRELEMEIRRLLRENCDKDKELQRLHREHERLEGRLNSSNAERSSCLARSAQLEQEARDAKRGQEVLQKQITSTETACRRKEEKLKEEVKCLQQQIQSKEQEIQTAQLQIVQALQTLVTEAEKCFKDSKELNKLFCRLQIPVDRIGSEEDQKEQTCSDSGNKEIDFQINKVHQFMQRVSVYVNELAHRGVEQFDWIQKTGDGEHLEALAKVRSDLEDMEQQHQLVQEQLAREQEQHKQYVEESTKQQTEELENMQAKIMQLQTDCEQAQQQLEQTQKDYDSTQICLQESLKEYQSTQSQMLQDQYALESRLKQEQEILESRLREEHSQVEQQLKQECLQAEGERLQTQQKLDTIAEELCQKDQKLKELEESFLQKQAELETTAQELRERLQQADEKLTQTQKDLFFKETQHEEALSQLEQSQECNKRTRSLLQESQDSCVEMQQQISALKQEADTLRELVSNLQKHRDSLTEQSGHLHLVGKELELKNHLLSDAVESLKDDAFGETETGTPTKAKQLLFEETAEKAALQEQLQNLIEENQMLDSSIQKLTTEYQNMIKDLESHLSAEKDRNCEMLSRISTAEAECLKLKEELDKTLLVNRDHVQNLNDFQDQIHSLNTENKDKQKDIESLETSNRELKATIEEMNLTLEAEKHTFEKTLEETRTHIEQQEVQHEQLKKTSEALKTELGHLKEVTDKEKAELDKKCQSLEQDKQRMMDRYKDDLQSVQKALALDRQTTDIQISELQLKLERAQKFNSQMKEELKKLLKDKEKLKDDSQTEMAAIQVKLRTTELQVTEANNQLDEHRRKLKHSQDEMTRWKNMVTEGEQSLVKKDKEIELLQSKVHHFELLQTENEEALQNLRSEKEALEEYADRVSGEHSLLEVDMEKRLQSLQTAALEERKEFERIIHEMSEKIQELEEEQQHSADSDEWRQKYEELFARVEPFMEQLDAFAAERNLLVGRSEMAEAEMAKMMDKYAKLLGHQNQKQKIQYISKLKDEYMQCRKEKEALKEKSNKQQNTIQKLEKKIQTLEGRKTFDPSQAFKHTARRETTAKADLKHCEPLNTLRQGEVTRSPLKQNNK